uniref:Uncharacterized protein n=1 Tax=Tanacetum cinerariifolium TaxID=118510 RepID=A0A699IA83_TANCI|nr:hypothetical protein [Tanacetum cinerariifolium]
MDGTLNDVRTALDDRLKGIRMKYFPQTIWRRNDKERAAPMIQAIDKQLKTRRIMRSLEKFTDSFDVEIDYGKTLDDSYSRRFDKYKEKFDIEIEQLANEYDLRVGMKIMPWMIYGGNVKGFRILHAIGTMKGSRKKNSGKVLDGAQPLGRVNGSRFMGMIRKETDEEGRTNRKM